MSEKPPNRPGSRPSDMKTLSRVRSTLIAVFAALAPSVTNIEPVHAQPAKELQPIQYASPDDMEFIGRVIATLNLMGETVSGTAERKRFPKGKHHGELRLDSREKTLLALNCIEEASVIGEVGEMGVLLTVLERLKNENFPATVFNVIEQYAHFSWLNNRSRQNYSHVRDNAKVNAVANRISVIEKYLQSKDLDEIILSIKKIIASRLELDLKILNSENFTFYHVRNSHEQTSFNKVVTNPITRKKVLLMDYLADQTNVDSLKISHTTLKEAEQADPYHPINKLIKASEKLFYIPRSKNPKGRNGHVHYGTYFDKKEVIEDLFELLPDHTKGQLDNWDNLPKTKR